MSTLDDKILGIKKHYYCSSSESEDEESECDNESIPKANNIQSVESSMQDTCKWDGSSKNTGPKGVMRDWQLYKQLEAEKRLQQEVEKIDLAKKLTMSSSPKPEDDECNELLELMNDDFILQYRKKRMEEMLSRPIELPKFGSVIHLRNGNEFLEAIDNEDKLVTVIIHIFENNIVGCKTMNNCLGLLCKQYPTVKFCKINSSCVGMSYRFKTDGVPAILVYKEGSIIGNFIRVTDELGEEFYDSDVENFLIEHGILSDPHCVPVIVQAAENNDSD